MAITDVEAHMESRQRDDGSPGWRESFHFDFWDDRLSIGGFARITLVPATRSVWYWSAVVELGEDLIAVVDTELDYPKLDASLESRGQGLWVDHICETPLEHWSVGSEAFALRVDNPGDMLGAALGELVPIGFDLEWEAAGGSAAPEGSAGAFSTHGYHQRCDVHGELLVGDRVLDVTGRGSRNHRWGDVAGAQVGYTPLAVDEPVTFLPGDGWSEWAVADLAGGPAAALPSDLEQLGLGNSVVAERLWAPVPGEPPGVAMGNGERGPVTAFALVADQVRPGWLEIVG